MLLHIDDNALITDLQDDFSDSFPLLKIEFYDEPHHYKERASDKHRILGDWKIGSIRKIHNPGELEIMSWYSAGRVERDFKEKFGLNVQVFRQENGSWIQNRNSDTLSLAEQMDRARHSLRVISKPKRQVEYDYL